MTIPFLISVPHGGLRVPDEVKDLCVLTDKEVEEDGDVGAAEIYNTLKPHFARFIIADIARAVIDLNRATDDRRSDGVVKTHTCWNVPVYRKPLPEELAQKLFELYYHPYHNQLTEFAKSDVVFAIDCHTMAANGPPVGPDPNKERPAACLSNGDGTCPQAWIEAFQGHLSKALGKDVSINDPFQGGYITRSHASEMPWMQLELSRAPYLSNAEKGEAVLSAMRALHENWPG